MSRYINLDEATDLLRGIDATMTGEFVADLLESLPTIDIVECGDCIFWGDNICKARRSYNVTYEDEFCSFGIWRKEG